LLQASVAVQVLVTEYDPAQAPLVVTSAKVKFTVPRQLSVAVAVANTGVAGQLIVVGAGKAAITGAVVSFIVMVLETGANALPHESVAVHVSITCPLHEPATAVENVDVLEVPLSKQPPLNPLVNEIVLAAGNPPQFTVIGVNAVMVGKAAGLTVIVLETGAKALPQESVAVHVSVTVPPQAAGAAVKVDKLEVPLSKHPPLKPFVNGITLGAGNAPQATVVVVGAVMVGKPAGLTVMILETGAKALPQESVAVQVSVTVPPQAEGIAEKVDGLEVPVIKQPPPNPFVNDKVLGAGIAPQATVVVAGAVMVGNAAGLIVIVLDCVIVLP
jgi:glycine cleavage system regulatory protein